MPTSRAVNVDYFVPDSHRPVGEAIIVILLPISVVLDKVSWKQTLKWRIACRRAPRGYSLEMTLRKLARQGWAERTWPAIWA